MSQLQLLRTRRFLPFFATQFFGAFNDNLFKNALMIGVAYRSMTVAGLDSERVVALSAGLFILPFFLFSASAGQLADKFSKTTVIRWVKAAEIVIMLGAALGFWLNSLPVLLSVLFLMGLQSTFFGPAKYSILPDLVSSRELTGGNALVETGTFIAILLGTIAGGLMIGQGGDLVGLVVVAVAVIGFFVSLSVPHVEPADPSLKLQLDPVSPMLATFRVVRKNRGVFLSILAISWFWFIGASFLTLLPSFGKTVLGANEEIVTLFLSLFCIGIAVGSLLCEKLGGKKMELGLVPFGSIGLSVAGVDLFFASPMFPAGDLVGLSVFLDQPGSWRLMIDFFLLAMFGGFFTVPLYTLIQERSEPESRSQVIAANNILNALFMVASAILLMVLPGLGATIPITFLILASVNALVAMYIYTEIPEFLLRFTAWIVAKVLYRIRIRGEEHLPEEGAAVLVANHVGFVDWLLISSAYQRPARFVMYHGFVNMPVARFLFRDAKVIPIAPAHEDEETLRAAFDKIAEELEAGNVVCIFPEGKLTSDGKMNPFKTGIEEIIKRTPVPVIPMALGGLWGSYFSRDKTRRPFRRIWSRITLNIGEPVAPEDVTAAGLEQRVRNLLPG